MDDESKRQVLRKLPYGMYIMTAATGERAVGSTLTWISQCSFRPPLVMVAIQRTSLMHEAVEKSRGIAVNLLAEGQKAIAEAFFRPPVAEGSRLGGFAYE